jgi:hypothetical protein
MGMPGPRTLTTPVLAHTLLPRLVLASLLVAPLVARAEAAWSTFAVRDGITLQKRPVRGSAYNELRGFMVIDAPPAAVEKAIWTMITADPGRTVHKREVLSRSADEVVVYDQVRTSIASDRDVTVRIRKVPHTDGRIEVRFDVANQLGPPPSSKYVRIPVAYGRWMVVPRSDGKSDLTYQCYSEPGGLVPALLVRGAQQKQLHSDIKRMLGQLKR